MKTYFVTGIGTEIGKTLISAVLVEKLQADYWKPVQSGDLHNTDTEKVQRLVSNTVSHFYPEAYRLTQPFSPHKSAGLDGVKINLDKIILPKTKNNLIIEGAGGLMVPLNDKETMVDLIIRLGVEVILVSKNYLGSINHTLLSIEMLKQKNIPLKGIIFNGKADESSEEIIAKMSIVNVLGRIPELSEITPDICRKMGAKISL